MTTYDKAVHIIAGTLPKCRGEKLLDAADRILLALQAKRIMPVTMVASPELFVRFHAHTRYLGIVTEYGYRYWYDQAIEAMMETDDWPMKIVTKTIEIDGVDITVDIGIAESTRKANNRQLLGAYQVIEDGATEHKVALPENEEIMP